MDSHLHGLRGTRMGRAVKTEKQVLEEIASMPVETPDMEVTGMEAGVGEQKKGQIPSGDNIDSITAEAISLPSAGSFTLHGLETSEGRWEKLTYTFGWLELPFSQWEDISMGRGRLQNGRFEKSALTPPRNCLATMRTIYWAMRAAYNHVQTGDREKMSSANQVGSLLRSIFYPSTADGMHLSNSGLYTADLVQYETATGCLKFFIQGHTSGSWFHHEPLSLFTCPDGEIFIDESKSRFPSSLCHTLFGEPDYSKVTETLRWIGGRQYLYLPIVTPHRTEINRSYNYAFSCFNDFPAIVLHEFNAKAQRAILLNYDRQDFSPGRWKQ